MQMASGFQLIICIFFLVLSTFAQTAEIDSVTTRRVVLEDSLDQLNSIINDRIQEGVDSANKWQSGFGTLPKEGTCDEETLYRELRKSIFDSLTASWGLKGYSLDKQLRILLAGKSYSLPLKDSIYRDINYIEGFSLNLKELSDVVTIDGHLIGLDKIGHFFSEGWDYFEQTHEEDKSLLQAIQWGRDQEKGMFGYATTGIYSYADLVSNFNGWRFWNKVLQKKDDPLKGRFANFFTSSYIGCSIQILDSIRSREIVRKWRVKQKFNLMDFLDGTWDEGNNCVSYNDPLIEEKVMARIYAVDPDFMCPRTQEDCSKGREKYGKYAKYILHPACLTVKSIEKNK
ncbi:MAG: hypothetical protein ACI8ZB_004523 [Desulforhopalus sp.]|jgi:hypothetical protein